MALCGIFATGIYSYKAAIRIHYNEADVIIYLLIAGAGAFLGGHILYALINNRYFMIVLQNIMTKKSFSVIGNSIYLLFGGSVFYGGLLGGILAFYIFSGKRNCDFTHLLDLITPVIPLFHFFGRIGCFLAGCCFGIKSHFGFIYSRSLVEESNGVIRFPVQLLEAFINLIIFFILLKLKKIISLK
jgi:phosphatidylglycerol:prolipoprotein diacylglycerol transferase